MKVGFLVSMLGRRWDPKTFTISRWKLTSQKRSITTFSNVCALLDSAVTKYQLHTSFAIACEVHLTTVAPGITHLTRNTSLCSWSSDRWSTPEASQGPSSVGGVSWTQDTAWYLHDGTEERSKLSGFRWIINSSTYVLHKWFVSENF